jgi:hypothetical protein
VCWRTEILRIVGGKPKGKRALGSPMRRWKCNINVDFKTYIMHTKK